MANGSGGKTTATEAAPPVSIECSAACDTCRSAPGIPFCRVEWSFLCAGCASVVHGNNWVVAVTPNLNPNPSPSFPPPNPSSDTANLVVHLSSDEEGAAGPRGRRRPGGRVESVMRYRQKRKNRTFEKTVRYANRKTNAELMPRADGKFARKEGVGPDAGVELMGMDAGEEMEPDWAEELGAEASDNDAGHPEIRLQ